MNRRTSNHGLRASARIFSGSISSAAHNRRNVVIEGLLTPPSTNATVWTATPAFWARAFLEIPADSLAERRAVATARLMRVISSSRSIPKSSDGSSEKLASRILETVLTGKGRSGFYQENLQNARLVAMTQENTP